MNAPKQVGDTHENLSELLHAIDPATLLGIVAAAAGLEGIERVEIRYRNPRVQAVALARSGGSKIVDCIYTVYDARGRAVEIWLLECELSWDGSKRRRWSLYVVAFEYELDADGHLVVFSPEPRLRERIRTKMVPKMRIEPIVIEPDQIERITDYDDARRRRELTILGCLFHCHEPAPLEQRVAVVRAAVVAIASLLSVDKIRAWRYLQLVMALVPSEVVKQGIQEL
ncbi:MAG TPA: hypothetical protein VK034_08300, partial [Enhygromyxa sp.]|nr:hypothetical protein [Enhygromyxa sp.]